MKDGPFKRSFEEYCERHVDEVIVYWLQHPSTYQDIKDLEPVEKPKQPDYRFYANSRW